MFYFIRSIDTRGNSPVYRVMGSLAWTAAARSVIGILKDSDDKRRRLMLPVKSNIADDFGGYAYRIGETGDGVAELQFEPDRVEVAIEDMADVAGGANAVAFGDFKQGYTVADRITRMLRDPYTDKPNVKFYATKRVSGDVVNSEAIKVLRVKA